MLLGLQAIHNMRVMHRDLKSANIFLLKDGTVKIGDMNVSKLMNSRGLNFTQTGTPYYASPEVWNDGAYNSKSDIWSLGIIFYELVMLKLPFNGTNMEKLFKRVVSGKYEKVKGSEEMAKVVRGMLKVDANKRFDIDQLLVMPGLKNLSLQNSSSIPRDINSELLKTIYMPKSLKNLKNRLPGAMYNDDIIEIH